MNGVHDMGGMDGFGPVVREPDEPVFHGAWERRTFALVMAMGASGTWTIDMGRSAREHRSPADYLSKTYYQLWLAGLEDLLVRNGLVTAGEIAAGRAVGAPKPVKSVLGAADVAQVLARGTSYGRPPTAPAKFKAGDRVRAKTINPAGHTRLPRYIRGHLGVIDRVDGFHVFADASAAGRDEAHWLYTVRFNGRELWGPDGDPTLEVSVDAWEPYLDPA